MPIGIKAADQALLRLTKKSHDVPAMIRERVAACSNRSMATTNVDIALCVVISIEVVHEATMNLMAFNNSWAFVGESWTTPSQQGVTK
mmetsp:Transcript_6538/g.14074  ORF Transcript_6538/g.14074 Transcript_6538/m.14074 type:complete len:88 (-) Transcript_6538:225-488(-)